MNIKDCPDALIADLQSRVAVICTHPWGPLGGNMYDKVVTATVLYFQRIMRVTTLRFNFTGSSIGWGRHHVQQVCDAADYLLNQLPNNPPSYILLVGYSYGALIAASASATIPACIGCISIAPPWAVQHWLLLFNSTHHLRQSRQRQDLPRLFIIGDKDNFTPEQVFQKLVKTFTQSTGAVLKDANHFFSKRETDLMSVIGQWLLQTYPQADGSLVKLGQCEFPIKWSSDEMMVSPPAAAGQQQQSSDGYGCGNLPTC